MTQAESIADLQKRLETARRIFRLAVSILQCYFESDEPPLPKPDECELLSLIRTVAAEADGMRTDIAEFFEAAELAGWKMNDPDVLTCLNNLHAWRPEGFRPNSPGP